MRGADERARGGRRELAGECDELRQLRLGSGHGVEQGRSTDSRASASRSGGRDGEQDASGKNTRTESGLSWLLLHRLTHCHHRHEGLSSTSMTPACTLTTIAVLAVLLFFVLLSLGRTMELRFTTNYAMDYYAPPPASDDTVAASERLLGMPRRGHQEAHLLRRVDV
ncbi:hypothetical protein ZWY2020_050358 [Hordeum vulgare]|nr:hypothetical protein ZWY2020_050358 [Hordeum vulgare]